MRLRKLTRRSLFAVLSPLAYIDPGTGSMILQVIVGGLAAAAVMAKLFWRRLLTLLRIRRPEGPRREPAARR